jgi:hypothetical protein
MDDSSVLSGVERHLFGRASLIARPGGGAPTPKLCFE